MPSSALGTLTEMSNDMKQAPNPVCGKLSGLTGSAPRGSQDRFLFKPTPQQSVKKAVGAGVPQHPNDRIVALVTISHLSWGEKGCLGLIRKWVQNFENSVGTGGLKMQLVLKKKIVGVCMFFLWTGRVDFSFRKVLLVLPFPKPALGTALV